jgi:hypothetical protein
MYEQLLMLIRVNSVAKHRLSHSQKLIRLLFPQAEALSGTKRTDQSPASSKLLPVSAQNGLAV